MTASTSKGEDVVGQREVRTLHLQPMMSTLLIGGVPAGELPPSEEYPWNTIRWVSAENMPTRRRVSIEEFEADMRAVRKTP